MISTDSVHLLLHRALCLSWDLQGWHSTWHLAGCLNEGLRDSTGGPELISRVTSQCVPEASSIPFPSLGLHGTLPHRLIGKICERLHVLWIEKYRSCDGGGRCSWSG